MKVDDRPQAGTAVRRAVPTTGRAALMLNATASGASCWAPPVAVELQEAREGVQGWLMEPPDAYGQREQFHQQTLEFLQRLAGAAIA